METKSLKTLAIKVLQRTRKRNQKETQLSQGGNSVETSEELIGNSFNSNNHCFQFPSFPIYSMETGKLSEPLIIESWLERLSDSERDIFEERAAIIEFDGGLEKERAEIEAIKQIIGERVILGKCDRCIRVDGCMLTRGQRQLC